jgi:hypothetical protein
MDHSHLLHEISLSKNVHHQFFASAMLMPILKNLGVLDLLGLSISYGTCVQSDLKFLFFGG